MPVGYDYSMQQCWTIDELGGMATSETLSRNVRTAAQPLMKFRPLSRPEMAFGAHNGAKVTFRKMSNLQEGGRVIGEFDRVPDTHFTLSYGEITVQEWSNSVNYTWTLSLLAKLSIEDMIIINLMNDMAKTLDRAASVPYRAADVIYTPTGDVNNKTRTVSTNGAPGAISTRPFSMWDLKNIVDDMRCLWNVPAYDGNDYVAVGTCTATRGIKDDPEYWSAAQFGDPERLFSGEVGRIYGTRIIEENHILNSNLPGGCGEIIFIGFDAVVEIVAYAEEIQAKIGMDYGRDKGVRWVWVGGFGKVWDFQAEGETRLVRVYSRFS